MYFIVKILPNKRSNENIINKLISQRSKLKEIKILTLDGWSLYKLNNTYIFQYGFKNSYINQYYIKSPQISNRIIYEITN